MTPLEMIAEWRKGCTVSNHSAVGPATCVECTGALIDALEKRLRGSRSKEWPKEDGWYWISDTNAVTGEHSEPAVMKVTREHGMGPYCYGERCHVLFGPRLDPPPLPEEGLHD